MSRVDPSDLAPPGYLDKIAPVPGFLDVPDPVAAFDPASPLEEKAPPAEAPPVSDIDGAPIDPLFTTPLNEPEPAPERPTVKYLNDIGQRGYVLLTPLSVQWPNESVRLIKRVAINPPTLWDIQDWAAGRLKTNFELMSRMTGIDPVTLGALRWPDMQALIELATPMLPEAMRTAIEATRQQQPPAADGNAN